MKDQLSYINIFVVVDPPITKHSLHKLGIKITLINMIIREKAQLETESTIFSSVLLFVTQPKLWKYFSSY